MYSVAYQDDIEQRASSKSLLRLLDLYRNMAVDGMPHYSDFNPLKLDSYRDWMAVLFAQANGDFLYGFAGSALSASLSFDLTGQQTSHLGEELGTFLAATARQAIDSGKPLFSLHRTSQTNERHLWERLVLPVRVGSEGLGVVTYGCVRSFQIDLVQALFEASDDGIIGATSVRDDAGVPIDAFVQTVNLRASAILGIALSELEGVPLGQAAPMLRDSQAWPAIITAMRDQTTISHDISWIDATGTRWLKVTASPLGDGVAVAITDISVNRQAMLDLDRQKAELTYANQVLAAQAEELSEIAFEAELARAKLSEEMAKRVELEAELKRVARFDLLTGVMNRLGFEEVARQHVMTAKRYKNELSMILVDADHFKAINDKFGHAGGDRALKHLAGLLADGVRTGIDSVGRIGGEEFAILLPQTGLDGAHRLAERLRATLETSTSAIGDDGTTAQITASFGVATFGGKIGTLESLMQRADMALYEAKNSGRNRVNTDDTISSAA